MQYILQIYSTDAADEFDSLPEAEQKSILGEYMAMTALSALAATLYLGGWAIPGVNGGMADLLGPIVLFVKLMAVAFLMFWVRFTYPRLREDQLQSLAWKFLIPIGLLNIIATAIIKVAV